MLLQAGPAVARLSNLFHRGDPDRAGCGSAGGQSDGLGSRPTGIVGLAGSSPARAMAETGAGGYAWGTEGMMVECEKRSLSYLFKIRQTTKSPETHRGTVRAQRLGAGRRGMARIVQSTAIDGMAPESAGGRAPARDPGIVGDRGGRGEAGRGTVRALLSTRSASCKLLLHFWPDGNENSLLQSALSPAEISVRLCAKKL